jgi:hypothetical protein
MIKKLRIGALVFAVSIITHPVHSFVAIAGSYAYDAIKGKCPNLLRAHFKKRLEQHHSMS